MILENINSYSLLISLLLVLFVIYFFWIYLKSKKSILSLIFLSISFVFLIIGLFSPRYGTYTQEVNQNGGKVLFVMDVSKSMNVFDISFRKNIISRLQAQKIAINSFIENSNGNSYGLFAFAGETLELLPYTDDAGLFQTILNGIDQNNVSKYGSDFQGLFQIISNYVEVEDNAGTIVIFTDGGEIENISLPQSLIQKLDKYHSQVILVGVGTDKGGYILDGEDVFGRPVYKIYNGKKVIAQLNKQGIDTVSNKYNFETGFLSSNDDISDLEEQINAGILKQDFQKNISLSRDISYIFIILFLIFFSLYIVTENRKLNN